MNDVMKRNPYYTLEMINGVPYLLPFGQNIADHNASFQLNETGVFLWNHLSEAENEQQLLDLLLMDEPMNAAERAEARSDLSEFIHTLISANVILYEPQPKEEPYALVSIAGIVLGFCGMEGMMPKAFEAFQISGGAACDLKLTVLPGRGGLNSGETVLLHNRELNVYETAERWHLEFPSFDNITSVVIDKKLTHAEIYVRYEQEKALLKENLFHVVRHLFLLKAQSCGLFAMHSASILYRGRAYLFSGPSGTGKSTHTSFWREAFGTEDLNGDLNLLSADGQVYGIPWCGTSGIFTVKQVPLGGIIFLKQAKEDRVELLEADRKSMRIVQRLISPSYVKEQLQANVEFAVNLGKRIPCWRLQCTKNVSAAALMKETIDHYLNRGVQ